MKLLPLATVLLLLPLTAFAETQLERYEAISERLGVAMLNMSANDIDQKGGDSSALRALDSWMPSWSDEMRAANGCLIDGYIAATSTNEVDAMLDRADTILPTLASMTMTEASESGVLNA